MTEAEKKEIVALVMSEISGQAVDFDLQTVTPQRTDILPAVRPDGAGGYTGVTLDWGGITDELTTQAKEFRDEALQAKRDTELLKSETNGIKSEVNDIYTQFNQAVDKTIESVRNVYQSDLNAESTARQTADNTLQQNIDSEASTRAEADTALGARIDSETTTRESEVAELERVNAIQKYEIENLKAKAEGKLYRTETVEAEAYVLDVPSSVAPYAEVQKIGGKSVIWNQLASPINKTISGVNLAFSDGVINVSGKATSSGGRLNPIFNTISFISGHIYFIFCNKNIDNYLPIIASDQSTSNIVTYLDDTNIYSPDNSYDAILGVNVTENVEYNGTIKYMMFDLTLMFGAGNEPALEECKKIFSEDYYPYDEGTIKSFPVKRVRSLNAEGTEIGSIDVSSLTADMKSAINVADEWENGKIIRRVGSRSYTSGDESDSSLITDGTTTYYPLATPTEETVPEIDNYIKVEGGRTLTFESDETVYMPIPSTTRFVVDLTTTTEETV